MTLAILRIATWIRHLRGFRKMECQCGMVYASRERRSRPWIVHEGGRYLGRITPINSTKWGDRGIKCGNRPEFSIVLSRDAILKESTLRGLLCLICQRDRAKRLEEEQATK